MRRSILYTLLFCMVSFDLAHADPAAAYRADWDKQIAPFAASFSRGRFHGVDGCAIQFCIYSPQQPVGALLILHGKSESYVKYFELARDLRDLNCAIYMFDMRGFGFSERLTDDPDKVHVRHFANYTADLATFMHTVIEPTKPPRILAIGHSLGALVLVDYRGLLPSGMPATARTLHGCCAHGVAWRSCVAKPKRTLLDNATTQPRHLQAIIEPAAVPATCSMKTT